MHGCRELGLKVWLYDEDQWPSGYSGGQTPLAGEQCRMKVLLARPTDEPAPRGARKLEAGGGVAVYEWVAPLGNPWFNGTCYTDLMSEAGTAQFLADAYASYAKRYAGDYGGLVTAQFTDEPSAIFRFGLPRGAVPWSADLPDRFRQMHGRSLAGPLHLLFTEAPEAAPCPRWHESGLPPVVQRRLEHSSIQLVEPRPLASGDVTGQSLPFYAGNLRLTTHLPAARWPRMLCLERLQAAVVEVALNGEPVGHIVSPPYELALPADGGTLALTLYGTLRNLLGPHHHPEGEMPVVSPPLFEPDYQPDDDASVADAVARWARQGEQPPRWTADYWVVGFGDLGRVTIREAIS